MAESRPNHEQTPREIVRGAMGVDYEKATRPDSGAAPRPPGGHDAATGAPHQTPQEIAEQARIALEARPDGRPDRDDRLTNMGRGRHTTGRLGGNS